MIDTPPEFPLISERPTNSEIEQLRQTLAVWDTWPEVIPTQASRVIEAGRAVLAVYDEQLAKYQVALQQAALGVNHDQIRALQGLPPIGVAAEAPHET